MVLAAAAFFGCGSPTARPAATATAAGGPTTTAVRWYTVQRVYPSARYDFDGRHGPHDKAPARLEDPPVTLTNVVLENQYVRIEVAPQAAGRVMHVTYVRDGTELFNVLDKVSGGSTWDGGGWRSSFPCYEHGMRFTDQPAGWRIATGADGSLTLVMDMHFGRFDKPADLGHYGRFSPLRLSRQITLRPGDAAFDVTSSVDNPTGIGMGQKLWNLAQLPYQEGAVLVLPTSRVCGHGGADMRDWTPREAQHMTWTTHGSVFSVDQAYPFAGIYYPAGDINRVRAGGSGSAKFWAWPPPTAFFELWGGMTQVFEEPGNYIDSYANWGVTERYFIARGIGQLTYANKSLAMGLNYRQRDGQTTANLRITPSREIPHVGVLLYAASGAKIAQWQGDMRPMEVVSVDGPVSRPNEPLGVIVKQFDGHLCSMTLPLTIPTSQPDNEKRLLERINPPKDNYERRIENAELNGWLDSYGGSLMNEAIELAEEWVQKEPANYDAHLRLGWIRYLRGELPGALEEINKGIELLATAKKRWPDQELYPHYGLGMVLMEMGRRQDAMREFEISGRARWCNESHYMLALDAIARDDLAAAERHMRTVVERCEWMYRPRVALACILARTGKLDEARRLAAAAVKDDASSPEALEAYCRCFPDDKDAAEGLRHLMLDNPEAPQHLQRFRDEVDKGAWLPLQRPHFPPRRPRPATQPTQPVTQPATQPPTQPATSPAMPPVAMSTTQMAVATQPATALAK
jgi:tetratricopeptide (TPR) repeat protein